jgi:hypothetical protein
MGENTDDKVFPLADLIKALGRDLREAQRRAKEDDQPDILKLKECSVELGVTWEKKGEAGIEFWVIKLGGEVSKQNVETLTVTLEPLSDEAVVMELTE